MDKLAIGLSGQKIAEQFLVKNGYKIILRNARFARWCEIDLLAIKNKEMVFVEVKTFNFGFPDDFHKCMNYYKVNALKRCARFYSRKIQGRVDNQRGDVIFVCLNYNNVGINLIKHFQSVVRV